MKHAVRMRIVAAVLVGVSFALSGCASDPTATGADTADCSAQIRSEGVVYTSHGYSEREAKKLGTAQQADCQDVGEDAPGSVFSDSSEPVTTWTFEGYPPTMVLGVQFDAHTFAVFVADSVPAEDRDRIYLELAR